MPNVMCGFDQRVRSIIVVELTYAVPYFLSSNTMNSLSKSSVCDVIVTGFFVKWISLVKTGWITLCFFKLTTVSICQKPTHREIILNDCNSSEDHEKF